MKHILLLLLATGFTFASAAEPVKVYILAGQSNMEGQGIVAADPKRNEGKGSLEFLVKDPATAPRFKHLVDASGKWIVRDDVFISYLTRKGPLTVGFGARPDMTGPELAFGNIVGDASDAPVLLIKCAWGGKSLAVDFRPPSAGKPPYSLGEKGDAALAQDPAMLGKYYRETVALTKSALADLETLIPSAKGRGYVLAGFGWHQGWNDRINDKFNAEYESNMAHFIKDIRKDLGAEKLPFVIAETGMTGPNETHPRALSLMKAQAAVAEHPEFKGNVAFVATRQFWREKEVSPSNQGFHWNSNAETYYLIGESMGRAMLGLSVVSPVGYQTKNIEGWTVHLSDALLAKQQAEVDAALPLLQKQLQEIIQKVPAPAVAKLREIPLWFSPRYPDIGGRAEYHPGEQWLRDNGRNPLMVKGVEFTDVENFAAEMIRMPNFTLHELAHGYHDRVLSFDQPDILAAYEHAKSAKLYEKVDRWRGNGKPNTQERAYGITNHKEYFAESTEAYFSRNDFFPFTRDELVKYDPEMLKVVGKVWGVEK
jgi:alpha-galactosidase